MQENQVLEVTLARLQECDIMWTCRRQVTIVAATREAVFHLPKTSFVASLRTEHNKWMKAPFSDSMASEYFWTVSESR